MNDASIPAETRHLRRAKPRFGQLVLHRDADPAARAARGDVRDLFVLPAGRRRRRFRPRRMPSAGRSLREWRQRHRGALCRASRRPNCGRWRRPSRDFALRKEDFLAVIDGMEMDAARGHPRAGLGDARPLLRPGGERGRPAVGARVRHGRERRHRARASSRPRAAAHQHPARPRRGRRHRPALSAARGAAQGRASTARIPRRCCASPGLGQVCDAVVAARARRISARPTRSWRATRAAWCKAPRIMEEVYRVMLEGMAARGWAPPRNARPGERAAPVLDRAAVRNHLMARTVHIIGAGLAGLAAAVELARRRRNGRRARGDRLSRRALPLLFRPRHRHDDRQRQPSGAVGQSCGAGLLRARSAAQTRLVGPAKADFRSSISQSASAGRCASTTAAAVVDFRSRAGACRARALVDYLRVARLLWVPNDAAVRRGRRLLRAALRPAAAVRCCSRRSTSSRRRARRRWPRRSMRETLARGRPGLPAADRARRA